MTKAKLKVGVKIWKTGNSHVATIPEAVMSGLNLNNGDEIYLDIEKKEV